MMQEFIKHVNAFTERPGEGNPAAVVKVNAPLAASEMQKIAREMNLSETAFVLPPTTKNADLRIRWFTTVNEVPLCGHATIASFHALAEEGFGRMDQPGEYLWRLQTRSGILPILVIRSVKKIEIKMTLPLPSFAPATVKRDLLPALRIRSKDCEPSLPAVASGYVYLPVKSLSVLKKISPDYEALRAVQQRRRWSGVCVLTAETVDRRSDFHSRFFAPNDGIDEDPVTGSANGPLGAYAIAFGLRIPKEGINRLVGEQGDWIGRKGRVGVEVIVRSGTIVGVIICGYAVTMYTGQLSIMPGRRKVRARFSEKTMVRPPT